MTGFFLALQLFSPTDPAMLRPIYEKAIALRAKRFGEESAEAVQSIIDYSKFLAQSGDVRSAINWMEKALAIKPKIEDKQMLAVLLEPVDASASAELHLQIAKSAKGEVAAISFSRLGTLAEGHGEIAAAESSYRKAIAESGNEEKLAVRLNTLALLLKKLPAKQTEAEQLFRRALGLQQRQLGMKHPEVAITLNNLSGLLLENNRVVEAEAPARRALEILDGSVGPEHVRSGLAASNLADVLMARGRPTEARKLYQRALTIFENRLGPAHQWTQDARAALRP